MNFPEAILDALKRDRLVIFAGAGVSIPPPSNFPNFEQLARQIGGEVFPLEDGGNIDRYLGRLCDKGVAVHAQVREKLSSPDSRPNDLHKSLVSLFKNAQLARIVTTNFDQHFTTAARDHFGEEDFDVFCAPALPLGNDFSGLVYIHGSVKRPPKTLVLTDADFGRAYITEGWAVRFLQQLFSQYVVLFVGYSHNDMVMHYLARGLTSSRLGMRFILSLPGKDDDWQSLGIVPVHYPVSTSQSKHAELGPTISALAEISGLGSLEIEERIKGIVEGSVPLDAESLDYIGCALNDLTSVRFFARHCTGVGWIK